MKKALVLLAIVVALGLVYLKFRKEIHGALGAAKEEIAEKSGLPTAPKVDGDKAGPPAAPVAAADEALLLIDSQFLKQLPGSFPADAASDPRKTDLVVEVLAGAEGGASAWPAHVRLTNSVSLDTSFLQSAGAAAPSYLVHLKSVGAASGGGDTQYVAQGTAEAAPAALDGKLRKQAWRKSVSLPPQGVLSPDTMNFMWATEFVSKLNAGQLSGIVFVEGTLDTYNRRRGNEPHESVTLKEAKGLRFFFSPGIYSAQADAADKLKKAGNAVTMRMKVNLDTTPKILAQELSWGIPIKDQHALWQKILAGKAKLSGSLALAMWSETRTLAGEAEAAYSRAHTEVARENLQGLGRPDVALRVHLADEAHDRWYYETPNPVVETGSFPEWKEKTNMHGFYAIPRPLCVLFKNNAKSEFAGDYYRLQ